MAFATRNASPPRKNARSESVPPKGKKHSTERQEASRPGRAKPTAKCVSRRAHNVQYLVQFYH
ncbi:hypothetical protein DW894_11975 [Ruminococcus sp. AM41-10BH]|nr:hypothetical protein DW894_11975 [Ruminococcus sp. AM41-10BH]